MSLTLDQAVAAPRTLKLAGRTFSVRPLQLRDWGELQGWLRDNGLSPLRKMRETDLDALSPYMRDRVLEIAVREQSRYWPPPVATRDWLLAMGDAPGGNTHYIWTILSRDQPDFTPEEADELRQKLTAEESESLFWAALGIDPPVIEDKNPKAPTPPPARARDRGGKPKSNRNATTGRKPSTR